VYGGDTVAPPGNQAVNGEHKLHAYSTEDLSLLDKYSNSPSHRSLRLYHHPRSGLSAAPVSTILSAKRDGKA
jgi:hypothetical protein